MLRIEDLCISFPNFTLDKLNITVNNRDFFAIIGPTGSGKTLLLESLIGLKEIKSGNIFYENKDITLLPPEQRKIGLVYQDYALFPHLTVEENILYGVKYSKSKKQCVSEKFSKLVKSLSIDHLTKRYPKNLSGGEKQRVALARVLILDMKLILLDEPLSALDPVSKKEIRTLLKQLHENFDVTIIIVSHDLSDIQYLANKGILLNKGEIIQQGTIQDILHNPNSQFAIEFVG